MGGKVILHYLTLMFFATWAISLLIRASGGLCRNAERDYLRPPESPREGADRGSNE